MRRLPWLALTTVLAGCAPLAHGGRARVLPQGTSELVVAPEVALLGTKLTAEGVTLPSLQLSLSYRHGVATDFELGARAWGFSVEQAGLTSWGASLDGKWQLARMDTRGRGSDISLAASVGYHQLALGGTPEHMAFVSLPLLFGFQMGVRNQLIVGPRVAGFTWWGESQKAQRHLLYGGSLAFAWAWGARWTFMPELVYLWSPVKFGGEETPSSLIGASFLSLGLGVGVAW